MLLYHYCSNDTFLSILRNSELWLSELTLSNDSMEGAWVWEMLREECQKRDIPAENLDFFKSQTNYLQELVWAFAFCMSSDGDVLSQWRGYADNGLGVAIGFDHETVKSLNMTTQKKCYTPSLQEVIYKNITSKNILNKSSKQVKDIEFDIEIITYVINSITQENIKRARLDDDIIINISSIFIKNNMYVIKNQAFYEECEWRIIISMPAEGHRYNLMGEFEHVNFRARNDHIVPYLRLPIPDDKKSCIREIILGPRNRTPEPVIRAALEKHGFQNVDVRRSAATYR